MRFRLSIRCVVVFQYKGKNLEQIVQYKGKLCYFTCLKLLKSTFFFGEKPTNELVSKSKNAFFFANVDFRPFEVLFVKPLVQQIIYCTIFPILKAVCNVFLKLQ